MTETYNEVVEAVPQGCGYFKIWNDTGDQLLAEEVEIPECHDKYRLEMDCVRCDKGEDVNDHAYDEPQWTYLTDCEDGCEFSIDHDGPCFP